METTVKTAEIRVPHATLAKARQMLADLHGNTRLCGSSEVVDGYWVETHTLGCRNAADEPEEQWEASHEAIRNEYGSDGVSLVLDDPDSSNFATITPQAGKIAAVDYDEMFNGFLKVVAALFPNDVATMQSRWKGEIKTHIAWAKQHLKKQDRIVWYLRWVRLMLLISLVGTTAEWQDAYVKPEAERMGRITGEGAEAAIKSAKVPLQNKLDHYLGEPAAEIQNTVFDAQSPEDLFASFKKAEDEWKTEAQKYLSPMEGDEIIIQFQDGWAWWKLGRGYCSDEAAAMGHCGNIAGKTSLDERILSLRKPIQRGSETRWEPYLTFILDGDGYIGEMKGRGNEKPAKRYHAYITALLERTDITKGIKGGGYLPSHNFSLSDLSREEQERLKKINPNLVPAAQRLRELGGKPDKELIRRISRGGHVSGFYDEKLNGWVEHEWENPGEYIEARISGDAREAYDIFTGKDEPYQPGYETNRMIRKVIMALPKPDLRYIESWLEHEGENMEADPALDRRENLLAVILRRDDEATERACVKLWDAWKAGITPAWRADVGEQLKDALEQSSGERGLHLKFGEGDFWNEPVKEYRPANEAANLTDGRTAWGGETEEGEEEEYYTEDTDNVDYNYQSPREQVVFGLLRNGHVDGRDTPSRYDKALKKLKPADRKKVERLKKNYDTNAFQKNKSGTKPFIDWLEKAFPEEFAEARSKMWNEDLARRAVLADFGQLNVPFPKGEGIVSEPAFSQEDLYFRTPRLGDPRTRYSSLLRKNREPLPPAIAAEDIDWMDDPEYFSRKRGELLEKLRALPYAGDIMVFGSMARGSQGPNSDIDLVIDLSGKNRHPAWTDLLKLARDYYGLLDPFIIAEGGVIDGKPYYHLWARNDSATGWIPSRNKAKMMKSMERESVPLPSLPKTGSLSKIAGLKGTLEYHREGDVLYIDMFALRPEDRGQGGGRIAWQEFESSIPKDIKLIRLFAGDTGAGISTGFWEKMGFSYVFDTESGDEHDQYMWKGVNGNPTPKPLETPEEEHGYDVMNNPEKGANSKIANTEIWYHGTSTENAEKILADGWLRPGMESRYKTDIPRKDAVYVTKHPLIAQDYSYSHSPNKKGVVLEVQVDTHKLMPDEDSIHAACATGSLGRPGDKQVVKQIRNMFLQVQNEDTRANNAMGAEQQEAKSFEEAWLKYEEELVEADETVLAGDMKYLAERIRQDRPALAKQIVDLVGYAAHLGPAKVVGQAKIAAALKQLGAKKFYHGSDAEFAPGTVLKSGRAGWASDYPEVNAFLEANRPKGMLSRKDSVFLTDSPDAASWWGRFVYEVQPIGKIEKNDYAWFEDLIVAKDNGELQDSRNLAGYYWNGEPHSNLWEYRVPEAAIVREAVPKKAAQAPAAPLYFQIEVPSNARDHFWVEPPEGNLEFWAFKDRPRCFYNQTIVFTFDHRPVAEAKVLKIEDPGESKCEQTGKFEKHYKVFWNPKEFKKYRTAAHVKTADTDILIQMGGGEIYGDILPTRSLESWFVNPVFGDDHNKFLKALQKRYATVATLEGVDVEPDKQGEGIGKALLQKFIESAKRKGASAILLAADTAGKQREGFDLYQWYLKQGFHDTGLRTPFPIMMMDLKSRKTAEVQPEIPGREPWQMKRNEYAVRPEYKKNDKGDWYTDETDEQWNARREKERYWEQNTLAALSLGKLTPQEAKDRHLTDVEPSKFKPLPETLYHVTTHASSVASSGLKTRYELLMREGGTGLGGGTDKAISFTTDLDTAQTIYNAIVEAIRVLNGKLTVQQMLEMAEKGTGAERPWITEAIQWGGSRFVSNKWQPGEPYPLHHQTFFEGKKLVQPGLGTADEDMPDAEPIGEGWMGGDKRRYHTTFKVKMTPEEQQEANFDFFKTWLATREHAGGPMNPLFFMTNIKALAATPESEVAILQFKPIPGAMGTQESALGEWRVYTGQAVQLVGTIGKTAAAFPADFDRWLEHEGGLELLMEGRWEYFEQQARQMAEADGKEYSDLPEDELNDYLNQASYASLEDNYYKMVDVFSSFKFPLTVYRALVLNPGEKPRVNDFGVFWAWDETGAYPYSGTPSAGETWVFRGVIGRSAIAWEETMRLNIDHNIGDLEKEIRLIPGAKVQLTGVKKQYDDKWLKPLFKQVTAATVAEDVIVLPAGTKLYRGIGEPVIHPPSVAADGALWFTESPTMARTYIPDVGSSIHTSLRILTGPPRKGDLGDIQKQLGIEYTDIDYKDQLHAQSYRPPVVYDELMKDMPYPDKKSYPGFEPRDYDHPYYEALTKWEREREQRIKKYVMDKLAELGYKPEGGDTSDPTYHLKVKLENGGETLLPADYLEPGTLLTFEPTEPLRIFDLTEGGRREGDLMEPDYRKYETFRKLAEAGYDGVKINDFAQVEGHGNVGHRAIGLFERAVPKIKEVARDTATHPVDLWGDIKKYGAARSIWFHGTSLRNSNRILKEGLNPSPKERVWGEDSESSLLFPSKESYGGVYVTRNLMTAIAAVKDKKATGGMTIVCAELQPNTLYLDEDDITFQLRNPIGDNMSGNSHYLMAYYLAATNDRWKQDTGDKKENFVNSAIKQWKFKLSIEGREMHPDLEKRLRDILPGVWFASLERAAAHAAKDSDKYNLMRAYSEVFGYEGYDYDQISSQIKNFFPTVKQGEEAYRNEVEKATRTLRTMVHGERFNPTARTVESVTYGGSNRIVAVIDIHYPKANTASTKDDPYVFAVRYGSIPKEFLAAWKENMGGHYAVRETVKAAKDIEIPNPLDVRPGRPDIIEDWTHLPERDREAMIKEAEVVKLDPSDFMTDQATVSRKNLDRFLGDPESIDKAHGGGPSGEHQKHPLVCQTNEGLWLYDGNHRSAAAKLLKRPIRVILLDLRPMEDLMKTGAEKPHQVLYHHTSRDNHSSILKHGLDLSFAQAMGGIFLTADPSSTSSNMDTWAVNVNGLDVEEDFTESPEGENWYVVWDSIPPERLRLIKNTKTAAYTAYVLTDGARNRLLAKFPPKFPDVIAHHVTVQFGVPKGASAPEPAKVEAVGYASDDSLEAVVVSVNGETQRPDGGTYHITLSLDRTKGRKPVHSNDVVKQSWEPVAPMELQTMPQKLAGLKNRKLQKAIEMFPVGTRVRYKWNNAEGTTNTEPDIVTHSGRPAVGVIWDGEAAESFVYCGAVEPLTDQGRLTFASSLLKKADYTSEEGFWAGEGNAASGITPVCPKTGRVGIVMRSSVVDFPNTYSAIGGAIKEGMSPQQSAKVELKEEAGYTGGITLVPAYVFTSGNFKYYNFIGIVPAEFGLHPDSGSSAGVEHADENTSLDWVAWEDLLDDIRANSGDYHPGFLKFLNSSRGQIEQALGFKPKMAGALIELGDTGGDLSARGSILEDWEDWDRWTMNMHVDKPDSVQTWAGEFPIAVLNIIRTPKKQRGKGLGKNILNQFLQAAKAKGATGILLVATPLDERKQYYKGFDLEDWYRRQGFRDIGSTKLHGSIMYKAL